MTRCIKYGLRIVQVYDGNRYPKCCYDILYQLDVATIDILGQPEWKMCCIDLSLSMCGCLRKCWYIFKQRVSDICTQNWCSDLTSLSKLDTYYTFEYCFSNQKVSLLYKCIWSEDRCSNNKLAIERLGSTPDRGSRYFKYCLNINNTYVVKNEYHFIMSCPLYKNIRRHFIPRYCNNRSAASFIHLMSSSSKLVPQNICSFTFHAFKLHSTFMGF